MYPLPIGQLPIFIAGFLAGIIVFFVMSIIFGKEPHDRVKKLRQDGGKR